MDYLYAVYRVTKRRDAYPSIPLAELISMGHLWGIELDKLGITHAVRGLREILVSPEIDARLVSAVPRLSFVRDEGKVYFVGSDDELGSLINEFDTSLHGAKCRAAFLKGHDWCQENGFTIAAQYGDWFFFDDPVAATLFRVRF